MYHNATVKLPRDTTVNETQPFTAKRIAKWVILGLLTIFLLWLGFKTYRLVQIGRSLLSHQQEAEALAGGGLPNIDPDRAEALVLGVRQDILDLKSEAEPFLFLTPYLGWIPQLGPTIEAAPHLLEMADAGTASAAFAVRGLKPALYVVQNDASMAALPELMAIIEEAEPDLIQAQLALQRVAIAREQIEEPLMFPTQAVDLFDVLDRRLPQAIEMLTVMQIMPEIMAVDGERTYLILAQNHDELRPTGGFLTGVGTIVVRDGALIAIDFGDANFIGEWWNKPFGDAPQPLYELMGLELFLFRDANFWPDYPTSAEQALNLYSYSVEVPPPDGAIAIDQEFLALLLGLTGPVEVPELGVRINQRNIYDQLREAWQIDEGESIQDWVPERKSFLGPVAAAVQAKLVADFGRIDPLFLMDTIESAIDSKHLQIYVRDPAVASVMDELNWDGRVENPAGQDVLMVVDTNVSYNKVNPLIDTSINYDVILDANGTGQANLQLHYTHNGNPSEFPCRQGTDQAYADGAAYDVLMDSCYWNYLRVYTPAGISLQSASRYTAPPEAFYNLRGWDRDAELISEVTGLSTIANFFLLPQSDEVDVAYAYDLPVVVAMAEDEHSYRLTVRKQAGSRDWPLTVTVTLPAGSELTSSTPPTTNTSGQLLTYELLLTADVTLIINFR